MSAVLKKLFKEKRSLPQKIDDTPKKEKKIKKKDIVIEPIEIRELAYYEFDMVNNIKSRHTK
jgi:hypothetical protein